MTGKTEYEIVEMQYWRANARRDFEAALRLGKILSEYNRRDPDFMRLLRNLGFE